MVAGGRLHQRAPHADSLTEGGHARAAVVEEAPALAQREGVGADGVDLRRQQRPSGRGRRVRRRGRRSCRRRGCCRPSREGCWAWLLQWGMLRYRGPVGGQGTPCGARAASCPVGRCNSSYVLH